MFGDPALDEGDRVESGVYTAGKGYPMFTAEPEMFTAEPETCCFSALRATPGIRSRSPGFALYCTRLCEGGSYCVSLAAI